LYVDFLEHGRELFIINAKNWNNAYKQVNEEIGKFFSIAIQDISREKMEKSREYFLEAMVARGLTRAQRTLSGIDLPHQYDIINFKSSAKPEKIMKAKRLVDQSLEEDPNNHYARLAKAMFLDLDGEPATSRRLVFQALLANQYSETTEIAKKIIHEKQKEDIQLDKERKLFDSVVGVGGSRKIYGLLENKNYYVEEGRYFNRRFKLDQVLNLSHQLSLDDLDEETTVKVFEKLRSLYFHPRAKVFFSKGKKNRNGVREEGRGRPQYEYQEQHNVEAMRLFNIASTVGNIYLEHVAGARISDDLPSIVFFPEEKFISPDKRKFNHGVMVDNFSSAAYLDNSYFKAMILLARSLCHAEIDECATARMVYSWVVDQAPIANIEGRDGVYFNVERSEIEKDRLIFLAADATGRVDEANLSDLFRSMLVKKNYQDSNRGKSIASQSLMKKSFEKSVKSIVVTHTNIIRLLADNLKKDIRKLRFPEKYTGPMEEFAVLAMGNEKIATLRTKALKEIANDYPGIYPYLVAHMKVVAPFIVKEQNEVIRRIALREIIPVKMENFLLANFKFYTTRIQSRNIAAAREYIKCLGVRYDLSKETAIDFASLYHRIGGFSRSKKLLSDFNKGGFTLKGFDPDRVDGYYSHNGFDDKGHLIYVNVSDSNIRLTYENFFGHGFGETDYKWSLSGSGIKKKRPNKYGSNKDAQYIDIRFSGRIDSKDPRRIIFDTSRFGLSGEIEWQVAHSASAQREKLYAVEEVLDTFDESALIELSPLNASDTHFDKHKLEFLLSKGVHFDDSHGYAIKGSHKKKTPGMLKSEHFSSAILSKRNINVVIEKLFDQGYLSVTGIPLIKSLHEIKLRVGEDFPDYGSSERRAVVDALMKANKLSNAGFVEIYRDDAGEWLKMATLIPDDASNNRHFGLATAISEKHALVCDRKDGLYSYKLIDSKWLQQDRVESRCHSVVMNNQWALVGSTEKVFVFKHERGGWQKTQVLQPDGYQLARDKGYRHEFFGGAMAILKDTLVIGNPLGGKGGDGEVYIYTLRDGQWGQSDVIQAPKGDNNFGASISATENVMVVGAPWSGGYGTSNWQSGVVLIYRKEETQWRLKQRLGPVGREKRTKFGLKVFIDHEKVPSLLINSKKGLYRYGLPMQP